MIRFLIYSLCCSALLLSCRTYQYPGASGVRASGLQELNTYYMDTTQALVYRADAQAFETDLKGNLVIRTLAPDVHRVALLSDLGQTLFDISIFPDKEVAHFIMADLDRKLIVTEIAAIFRVLTQRTFASSALVFLDKQHYPVYFVDDTYYLLQQREVRCITRVNGSKERFSIEYSDVRNNVPVTVLVEHGKFPLRMQLSLDKTQSSL